MSFKFDMSCFMPLVLCVYNELKIFSLKTIALIFFNLVMYNLKWVMLWIECLIIEIKL